jgi:hypothetical protein
MKVLLWTERVGNRIHKWWRHTGDHGQDCLTVETSEDAQPVMDRVKRVSDNQNPAADFRLVGEVPGTVIDEMAKISAARWGVSVREAFAEITKGETDRAQSVLNEVFRGRDYRKFQAEKIRRYFPGGLG